MPGRADGSIPLPLRGAQLAVPGSQRPRGSWRGSSRPGPPAAGRVRGHAQDPDAAPRVVGDGEHRQPCRRQGDRLEEVACQQGLGPGSRPRSSSPTAMSGRSRPLQGSPIRWRRLPVRPGRAGRRGGGDIPSRDSPSSGAGSGRVWVYCAWPSGVLGPGGCGVAACEGSQCRRTTVSDRASSRTPCSASCGSRCSGAARNT